MKIRIPTLRFSDEVSEIEIDPNELGSAGLTYGSLGRLSDDEYSREMTGKRGYETFDRMRKSDPKVAGLRKALDLPLIRANWQIIPSDANDPRSMEIAQFVDNCLFHSMDISWETFLSEAMLYLDYGFAPFEKVWMQEDDQIKIKHFGFLPPKTIQEIYVKNRQIVEVVQNTAEKGTVTIPGSKLFWFVNQKEGDNYRGISLLRSMYKPWYNKERAEILFLILSERMGGWLKLMEPLSATDKDIQTARAIGRDFRINESMFMLLPAGWDASIERSEATLADILAFIKHNNEELSNVAIAQVLDLGKTETGSRALGRTLGDMFVDSIQARANYVESMFNDSHGPIAELCSYNFPDWLSYIPMLSAGRVDKIDIKTMALSLKALGDAGMVFGENIWRWIRIEAEMPLEDEMDAQAQEEAQSGEEPEMPYEMPSGYFQTYPRLQPEYDPAPGEIDEQPTL